MIFIKTDVLMNVQIVMGEAILNLEDIMEYKDINVKNVTKLFLEPRKLYGAIQKNSQKNGLNLWN
ncbi:hypothetical protein CNEONATNEC32_01911 [Clostridium neonatale]|nr:hypothetical protein CNEO4_190012 [Clostridium neonatale]SUQ47276.1 hypothetical protein CNEONATNEC32_01911 [Clostridium neonatale]